MHSNLSEAAILNITNMNLSSFLCGLGITYFGHERLFLFLCFFWAAWTLPLLILSWRASNSCQDGRPCFLEPSLQHWDLLEFPQSLLRIYCKSENVCFRIVKFLPRKPAYDCECIFKFVAVSWMLFYRNSASNVTRFAHEVFVLREYPPLSPLLLP